MDKKTAELIVKIIAILGFIGAVISIISGILAFAGVSFLFGFGVPSVKGIATAISVATGIISIILGIVGFIVALGLWNFKNWARIVTIIFAVLSAIASLPSLIIVVGIIPLAISIAIIYLLGFQKEIVALFK